MTIKSLPLEHLFHTSKPFLIHSAQLDYPETGKYSWKESQNLQLYIPIATLLTTIILIVLERRAKMQGQSIKQWLFKEKIASSVFI